jgi:hypothetical protein
MGTCITRQVPCYIKSTLSTQQPAGMRNAKNASIILVGNLLKKKATWKTDKDNIKMDVRQTACEDDAGSRPCRCDSIRVELPGRVRQAYVSLLFQTQWHQYFARYCPLSEVSYLSVLLQLSYWLTVFSYYLYLFLRLLATVGIETLWPFEY